MKRFIRAMDSGLYYGQAGWTADPALARHFSSFSAAVQTMLVERLSNVELVLQLGDKPSATYDVRLPLCGPLPPEI